ncbi:hypothetical protein ACTJJ4_11680 [Microbacterium sp. 22195]|uniref:hypothetical protein n=1 Tax=Microbacterium sp. 22195 TaxID=3453891 RepID=UPI003F879A41
MADGYRPTEARVVERPMSLLPWTVIERYRDGGVFHHHFRTEAEAEKAAKHGRQMQKGRTYKVVPREGA